MRGIDEIVKQNKELADKYFRLYYKGVSQAPIAGTESHQPRDDRQDESITEAQVERLRTLWGKRLGYTPSPYTTRWLVALLTKG
jgi:hypothetical protein